MPTVIQDLVRSLGDERQALVTMQTFEKLIRRFGRPAAIDVASLLPVGCQSAASLISA